MRPSWGGCAPRKVHVCDWVALVGHHVFGVADCHRLTARLAARLTTRLTVRLMVVGGRCSTRRASPPSPPLDLLPPSTPPPPHSLPSHSCICMCTQVTENGAWCGLDFRTLDKFCNAVLTKGPELLHTWLSNEPDFKGTWQLDKLRSTVTTKVLDFLEVSATHVNTLSGGD